MEEICCYECDAKEPADRMWLALTRHLGRWWPIILCNGCLARFCARSTGGYDIYYASLHREWYGASGDAPASLCESCRCQTDAARLCVLAWNAQFGYTNTDVVCPRCRDREIGLPNDDDPRTCIVPGEWFVYSPPLAD